MEIFFPRATPGPSASLKIKPYHNLYNKTNGWTEWADIFWGHSGVIFFLFFFSQVTPGPSASL